MANYCDNDLYVSGNEADIKTFLEYARGEDDGSPLALDFRRFIPEPDQDAEARGRGLLWERWGTSSNALDTVLDAEHPYCPDDDGGDDHRAVKFNFTTNWSPPIPVVLSAARRFRSLRFSMEYYEAGMGFHGRYTCEAGQPVEDLVGKYFGSRGG